MRFSIVFPSRGRVPLLTKMLESLKYNTARISEVEVLIAIDQDDTTTKEFLDGAKYSFVRYFVVPRSLNFSWDYYTFLALQSTGQWIICANDDCIFETDDWDALAYETLKDQPGIVYGWIEDGIGEWRAKGHGNYCCFPLQGREGFEILGYIFPPRIPTWGADIWAKMLYDSVNSVVILPFTMRHFCVHNFTREQDEISARIARNQVSFGVRPTYEEVNKLLAALKEKQHANC